MTLQTFELETNNSLKELLIASNEAILSDNTRLTYEQQWKLFVTWCSSNNYRYLPSDHNTILLYLNYRAINKCSSSTLQLCLYAINWCHKINGFPAPRDDKDFANLTNNLLKLHRRTQIKNDAEQGTKRHAIAATTKTIQDMLYAIKYSYSPDNIKLRDSAMISTAYSTAARRSELSILTLSDIEKDGNEYRINIRRSKTDQIGTGRKIGVINGNIILAADYLRNWLDVHPLNEFSDPLFPRLHNSGECINNKPLSGESIARRFGYWGRIAGYDGLTGHSTRRGAATEAARSGKNTLALKQLGGWKSSAMPERYVEDADALLNHPLRDVI